MESRKRSSKKLAMWVMMSAAALVLTTQQSAAAGFKTQVQHLEDDQASVTFQPTGSTEQVPIYNEAGEEIASFNWKTGFSVTVSNDTLLAAQTSRNGIDLQVLLKGIVQSNGDKTLVPGVLPQQVTAYDGTEMPVGSNVFFAFDRFSAKGQVEPVNAHGRKMGPKSPINEFNHKLLTQGIKGQKKAQKDAAEQVVAKPSHGVHGEGRTQIDASEQDAMEALGLRVLSAPMCNGKATQRSHWGRRKPFKTKNGRWASSWHDGVDVAAKSGTPILAAADGCIVVKDVKYNRGAGYGLSLSLEHGEGLSTQYSHMQNFSPEIQSKLRRAKSSSKICVQRGEHIGYVGQTGNCTGPHLHFGVKHKGKSVNPRNYLMAQSDSDFSKSCDQVQQENLAYRALDIRMNGGYASAADAAQAAVAGRVTR